MMKLMRMSMRKRNILEGYSFISLWLIGFLLFMAVPLGKSLYYSFNQMVLTTNGLVGTYSGFAFYRDAFTTDVNFLPNLMSTITTMLVHVPLIIIFAMFSALLLNRPFRGRMMFRSFFFLPVIIASGVVLQTLMNQGAATLPIFVQYDLATALSKYIPLEILLPLLRMMESLTLVMWDSGVQILIFLAGLQAISPSLYEAAKCDGATPWESFWKITFPMITPMILVNILFSVVNSFTKVNNSVMVYINTVAFKQNDYGYGAALGWIYFIIIFFIILLVMFMFRNMDSPYTKEGR